MTQPRPSLNSWTLPPPPPPTTTPQPQPPDGRTCFQTHSLCCQSCRCHSRRRRLRTSVRELSLSGSCDEQRHQKRDPPQATTSAWRWGLNGQRRWCKQNHRYPQWSGSMARAAQEIWQSASTPLFLSQVEGSASSAGFQERDALAVRKMPKLSRVNQCWKFVPFATAFPLFEEALWRTFMESVQKKIAEEDLVDPVDLTAWTPRLDAYALDSSRRFTQLRLRDWWCPLLAAWVSFVVVSISPVSVAFEGIRLGIQKRNDSDRLGGDTLLCGYFSRIFHEEVSCTTFVQKTPRHMRKAEGLIVIMCTFPDEYV